MTTPVLFREGDMVAFQVGVDKFTCLRGAGTDSEIATNGEIVDEEEAREAFPQFEDLEYIDE